MKIISWNVNGLRSVYSKGLLQWLHKAKPDILCLQEIKASEDKIPAALLKLKSYCHYFNHAQKPGYSGTAVFTKEQPSKAINKIGLKRFDDEGRFLRLDFEKFILINVYLPHGGRKKEKLGYKLACYKKLFFYLKNIKGRKPVILAGDFNIAHSELDLARPKQNRDNIMFTPTERKQLDILEKMKFKDSFRIFHKDGGHYSWWPYMANARARNLGWRIDYIFVPNALARKMTSGFILPEVKGSDHCPVGILIKI